MTSHESTVSGKRISTTFRPWPTGTSNQKPPTRFFKLPDAAFFLTGGGRPPKGPGTTCVLTKGANESDSVPSPTRSGSSKDPALRLVTGCELDMMVGGAGRDQAMIGGAAAAVVID